MTERIDNMAQPDSGKTTDAEHPAGVIVVISAPSGAGKTSVLNGVLERRTDASFSVSVTTRPPRAGEIDGTDYYFVGNEDFDCYLNDDAFVEWAEVHGNRYGTLRRTIDSAVAAGRTLILDTDTVGAFNIKKCYSDAVLIFIAPPSPEALRKRLTARNTDSAEVIRRRLDAAPEEIRRMREYDYVVVNDDLTDAIERVNTIIDAEKMKTKRILHSLTAWRISW